MSEQRDILLDEDDDLLIRNGDLVIGDSLTQEVGIILRLNQGELKSDPLMGPNLIQLVKSSASEVEIRRRIQLHLARDKKDYNLYKNRIKINGIN